MLESGVLRQGSLSKAARGYHLAQGNNERPVTRLAVLPVAAKASVEQGLEAALESAPRIGCITTRSGCAATQKAKAEILLAIARVRHALVLFGGIVPRKATTHLRALLNDADAVLLAADTADEALFRTEVVGAKLALTEWLIQRGWRPFLNEAGEKK